MLQSFVLQVAQGGEGNSFEAQMGELQNTLALLVVASAKSTFNVYESRPTYMNSSQQDQDQFEYRAIGKLTAIVAMMS